MTKTLTALALAATLTGCIGPEARVNISRQGTGNVDEMRADLKACLDETLAFEFIPDFGITGHRHRVKCMKERGWAAGSDLSGGSIPNFYRIAAPECPDHYTWNGNGCSRMASTPTTPPDWATAE